MEDTPDFYSFRLAAMNESTPVLASQDIVNQQGAMLLKAGNAISTQRAQVIAQHKLVKPLEHCVTIESAIDAEALYKKILKLASQLPGLNSVLQGDHYLAKLQDCCKYYEEHPLLRQKLTVLANQLPEIFFNGLYSAAAGVIIAHELDLPTVELRAVFIGGLLHNSGFLHIDPELIANEEDLEREDSLAVQAHPIIAKHFFQQVPGLPKIFAEAVGDHHERTDGTGYPKHKFGEELSIASQVIAFTDTIITAYKSCEHHGEYAHQLMMTIVQFNNSVHFEEVYKAAAQLMRLGPKPDAPPMHVPDIDTLLKQQKRIAKIFDASKKLALVLMSHTKFRLTKSIASMLGRLVQSIISAGVIQDEYGDWLDSMRNTTDTNEKIDLLRSHIMQQEIEKQLKHFIHIMWLTTQKIPEEQNKLLTSVEQSFQHIEKIKGAALTQ